MTTAAAAAAKLLQSCPTLCNPIDGSPPGSPVPGILQARILEWVAISFSYAWKGKVKVKSCLTPSDPVDCSLPGSSIHGTFPARILEWVAISFSNAWKWKWSRVWLLAILWTAAYQAPPSMGPSQQEYWSGLPLPSTRCTFSKLSFILFFSSIISVWFFVMVFIIHLLILLNELCLFLFKIELSQYFSLDIYPNELYMFI